MPAPRATASARAVAPAAYRSARSARCAHRTCPPRVCLLQVGTMLFRTKEGTGQVEDTTAMAIASSPLAAFYAGSPNETVPTLAAQLAPFILGAVPREPTARTHRLPLC